MHGEARLHDQSPGKPPISRERRLLVEHHELVVITSPSADRRQHSKRALATLRTDIDEQARLARIAVSAPPSETFDGMLQRWREMKAAEQLEDLEVIWDGTMGHDGKALTDGEGLGSSLGGQELKLHR